MLVSEFIPKHLEYIKTNFSPKTYELYQRVWKVFRDVVGDIPLTEITPYMIEQFKIMRGKTVSKTTVNIDLRSIRAALNTALQWGLIEQNPCKDIRQIRIPDEEPCSIPVEKLQLLFSIIKEPRLKDVCSFALHTGARRSEILGLKWKNIDLKNKLVTFVSSGDSRVKMGKMRKIPLNPSALDIILKKHKTRTSEYVFTSASGRKINPEFLTKRFKQHARMVGLGENVSFHSLRHTFATLLCQSGVSLYHIQRLLGHSKLTVTEKYAHLASEDLVKSVNKLSRVPLTATKGTLLQIGKKSVGSSKRSLLLPDENRPQLEMNL